MDISQLRNRVKQSREEFASAKALQQRCERLFTGVPVTIEYGDDGHATIVGLTPEQLKELMTPWA